MQCFWKVAHSYKCNVLCCCMLCIAGHINSRCHSAARVLSSSSSEYHEMVVTSGFVSSPNYPHVYAMTADCWWTLTVQRTQTLRLTLYDFELAVKTDNVCRDYLRITGTDVSSSEVTVFEDCGSRGLEVFDTAAIRVHLYFHTDQSSQAHRGFLIHYTGSV